MFCVPTHRRRIFKTDCFRIVDAPFACEMDARVAPKKTL
jgi:hypothetical protein